jgi:hypothetical protein
MKIIGIVGAGQLGSRHLQSLAGIVQPLLIYVVDVNSESLRIAKERFEEVGKNREHTVHYINSIGELPANMDIVIVATNSLIRRVVIEELLKQCDVKHLILEKFLFPSFADYEKAEELFAQHSSTNVWVNCPRRTTDLYKDIAANITGQVHFSVTGSGWGLGCNSIHFVDVFSKIVNDGGLRVLEESLDNSYIASKRAGYVEFSGSLYLGSLNNQHKMELVSFKEGSHPIVVKISTPVAYWNINESSRECIHASAADNWKVVTTQFNLPPQSVGGTKIITDLLETHKCELTPYSTSQALHKALLNTFLEKFSSISKETKDICPIT